LSGYRFIKSEVMRRVLAQAYPAGGVIPGEVELAVEFGVARATVNRALRELSDEGILERKRHSGTRVTTLRTRHAKLEIPLIRAEIEATGTIYHYELIERQHITAPQWLLSRWSLAEAGPVIHLRCLHFASGTPHIFEDRWINLLAVPQAVEADFASHNPNEWLVNAVPFTTAEFAFSATPLDAAHAKLLGAKTGNASFVAERVTWLGQTAVTYARLMFRPGYQMVTRT
jgi:GntR family transcriptional regulator, histidine utilization repressor